MYLSMCLNCSLILTACGSGSSKMARRMMSMKTVLSPRMEWPVAMKPSMILLLTVVGSGVWIRISLKLAPSAMLS